jgi:hypothetical protein
MDTGVDGLQFHPQPLGKKRTAGTTKAREDLKRTVPVFIIDDEAKLSSLCASLQLLVSMTTAKGDRKLYVGVDMEWGRGELSDVPATPVTPTADYQTSTATSLLATIQLSIFADTTFIIDITALTRDGIDKQDRHGALLVFCRTILASAAVCLVGFAVQEDMKRLRALVRALSFEIQTVGRLSPTHCRTTSPFELECSVVDMQVVLVGCGVIMATEISRKLASTPPSSAEEGGNTLQSKEMGMVLRVDLFGTSLRKWTKLLLGRELDKEYQCSEWDQRPLQFEQLAYAALDAIVPILLLQEVFDEPEHFAENWSELFKL